jgi:hypothetical protein
VESKNRTEGDKASSELGGERNRSKKVKSVRKKSQMLAGAARNVGSRRDS